MPRYRWIRSAEYPPTRLEQDLAAKEKEVLRREEELTRLQEEGRTVYKPGLPSELGKTSVPATPAEWKHRTAEYKQAYKRYLNAHRYARVQEYKSSIEARQEYYMQLKQLEVEREQSEASEAALSRWNTFATASQPFYAWQVVPSEQPIGEKKAWQAFGQPSWKETTVAGWFYSTGERMKATGNPVMQSLAAGPIQLAGLISPFESLFRPEIPTPSSALITSAQESVTLVPMESDGLPVLHSGPRFSVLIDPKKSETMEEFEGLDWRYGEYAIAGEIALAWLTGKATAKGAEIAAKSRVGKYVISKVPSKVKNLFVKETTVTERKYYTEHWPVYKKRPPVTSTTYTPTKYVSVTKPSGQEQEIARRALGWVAKQQYSPPKVTRTSLNKTFGHAGQMLQQLTERPVKTLPLLELKTKAALVTKQLTKGHLQRVGTKTVVVPIPVTKTVSEPTAIAETIRYAAKMTGFYRPPKPPAAAPPPSRYRIDQWGQTGLAQYPGEKKIAGTLRIPKALERRDESLRQQLNQQQKQTQRQKESAKSKSVSRLLHGTSVRFDITQTQVHRLGLDLETGLLQTPVLIPRIPFPTPQIPTEDQVPPPYEPPPPDPPGEPSFPNIDRLFRQKRKGKKTRRGFGGGWTLNLWPVRTISSYEDLRKVVGV